MRFLVQKDYERLITVDDLNQVFDNGSDTNYTVQQRIKDTEPVAQEEISGYLKQRYDLAQIFTDTPVFYIATTYYGKNRVQYHEPDWSSATTYAANDRVNYQGSIYFSIAGSNTNHLPTDATKWTFVCLDYQLFYALLPQPEYDYTTTYDAGQQVWFQNGVYTSKVDGNYYPPTNSQTWTFNSSYSFTGALPTDGTKWIMGDNRNALLVQKMVDIVLYHALSTITTKFQPENRILRYMGDGKKPDNSALAWLTKLSTGELSANLPELPPSTEELSLRWGNNRGDSQGTSYQTSPMSY